MFYCVPCQIKNKWPPAVQTVLTTCSSCQEKKECFNVDVMSIVSINLDNPNENRGDYDDHREC